MSKASNDQIQSGGINVEDGTVNTGGGDITGRDNFAGDRFAGSMYVAGRGDKSQENIVEILKMELREKNNQITKLMEENKSLNRRIDGIDGIFIMVKSIIGEHTLTVNDYISYTCIFLAEKRLKQEFQSYLPIEVCKAGKKDG